MQSVINCVVMVVAALAIVGAAIVVFVDLAEEEYKYPVGYFFGILSVGLAYTIYKIVTALPH